MGNLGIPLLIFHCILSVHTIPRPTPTTTSESGEEQSTTTISPEDLIEYISGSQNVSDVSVDNETVARAISERTGKSIGVPSDYTKQFNMSLLKSDGDNAPAQLNAGPGPAVASTEHKGNNSRLTDDSNSNLNASGDAKMSLTEADVKPVEAVQPRLLYVEPEPTVATPEDRVIQKIFGGECGMAVWNKCSRIKFWGGNYMVPDPNDPEKMIMKSHKIRCIDKAEKTLCLRNGWTVARCHMLCMSQCNLDFRLDYEKLVSHEGDCQLAILGKK